jgi:DNA-binding NarL/FixJ family response regulator
MFISPSVDLLGRARSASQGFVPSPAQLAVLRLAGNGMRATQIAVELGLSRRTVESHKYLMMQKLELTTTIQLVSWAVDEGYV